MSSSVAGFCSSTSQNRTRCPLLPPEPTMVSSSRMRGYASLLIMHHQVRILWTANSAAFTLIPTLIHPFFFDKSYPPCGETFPSRLSEKSSIFTSTFHSLKVQSPKSKVQSQSAEGYDLTSTVPFPQYIHAFPRIFLSVLWCANVAGPVTYTKQRGTLSLLSSLGAVGLTGSPA